MRSRLGRIHPDAERELARLTGRDSNYKHLVRVGDEHFTAEVRRADSVGCLCNRIVQVELATVFCRLTMAREVQPHVTEWLIRHEQLRLGP